MGIEKIKTSVVSTLQGVAKKRGGQIAEKSDEIFEASQEIASKNNKLTNTLSALSSNAKAMVAQKKEAHAIKISQDVKVFNKGQKLRTEALMAESQMFGLNKTQAKNAADALMQATGKFSHKDAEKSAEILKDAPLPQEVFKQELLLRKAQREAQKATGN